MDRRARRATLRAVVAALMALVAGRVARRLGVDRTASVAGAAVAGAAMEWPAVGLGAAGPVVAATAFGGPSEGRVARLVSLAGGSVIGLATRALWPVAPTDGAELRAALHRSPRAVSPDGERLTVVVNPGAGGDHDDLLDRLRERLPGAAVEQCEQGDELPGRLRAAAGAPVIGVMGGDGSINAAVEVALDADRALAVFPGGTLNHFARDLGLSSVDDTADAIASGSIAHVDVGLIEGRPFLNTASFGSYAALVDERESLEPRLGKWLALAVSVARVLREGSPSEVWLDDVAASVWMIFIGNCEYEPAGLAPGWRATLDDGCFDVRWVDAGRPWSRTRLVAALLTGQLGRTVVYRRRVVRQLRIRSADGALRLARDGETFDGGTEVLVTKHPRGLDVYAEVG